MSKDLASIEQISGTVTEMLACEGWVGPARHAEDVRNDPSTREERNIGILLCTYSALRIVKIRCMGASIQHSA